MLYDIKLVIRYAYEAPVAGGRHLMRVMPRAICGGQRLIAGSLAIGPRPSDRTDRTDFFGNALTMVAFRDGHLDLAVEMLARVEVAAVEEELDVSPSLPHLRDEIAAALVLTAAAPHHFLGPSPRIPSDAMIADHARAAVAGAETVRIAVERLGQAIHRDFTYDGKATKVDTTPRQAFDLKRGVCQDFSHIMICGLRALGIPAGYVSGFLRTEPPKGRPRLEGADAMHAWVRAWGGQEAGWIAYDPTNRIWAGTDHIVVAHGRDYGDCAPVIGVLRTFGGHETSQSVDVIPVGDPA